jgi:hypothetical protein
VVFNKKKKKRVVFNGQAEFCNVLIRESGVSGS